MTGLITFENIKTIVKDGAPLLATALGSPISGMILSLLADKFGVDVKDTNKLLEALKNDPDTQAKLQQIENAHCEALEQINSDNYKAEIMDRQSARTMQNNLQSFIPSILAIGFLFNYAFIQFYCVTHNITSDILARFHDVLIMIMSYYFGSSHKYFSNK